MQGGTQHLVFQQPSGAGWGLMLVAGSTGSEERVCAQFTFWTLQLCHRTGTNWGAAVKLRVVFQQGPIAPEKLAAPSLGFHAPQRDRWDGLGTAGLCTARVRMGMGLRCSWEWCGEAWAPAWSAEESAHADRIAAIAGG